MRASSSVVVLMDCKNLEIDQVPHWFNAIASFNCMTLVHEQLVNRWVRVLQASREVLAMATRGMTVLHCIRPN